MGIIDGQMMQAPPAPAPAPAQAPPQAPAQAPTQPPAQQGDPHAPEKYSRVVLAATKILYDPGTTKKILAIVKGAQTPEIGLAQATSLIMGELDKMSKNTIPKEVKVPAAKEVMALIAELAEKAGIIPNAAAAVAKTGKLIAYTLMKTTGASDEQLKQKLSTPGRASGAFQPVMRKSPPAAPPAAAASVEGV